MVLRIEPALAIGVGLVFALLIFQNQESVEAIESNASKELTFKAFSLVEITPKGVENYMNASEAIKYQTHFEMHDINMTYQNIQHLTANRASYQDDVVYLNDSVQLIQDEGFRFETSKVAYLIKAKELYGEEPFQIDMNESRIVGTNLRYDVKDKNISADNIRAKIYFE